MIYGVPPKSNFLKFYRYVITYSFMQYTLTAYVKHYDKDSKYKVPALKELTGKDKQVQRQLQ